MDTVKQRQGSVNKQDTKTKNGIGGAGLWSRLSPLNLFRLVRDSYIRGCVTFGNSSKVNAIAQSSAFRVVSDESVDFSRSNSRNVRDDLASAQELLDLSIQFNGGILEQPCRTKHLIDHNGLTLADLQGYSGSLRKTGASGMPVARNLNGHSGPLRAPPSFDAVPESEQYTNTSLPSAFTRSCSERPQDRLPARYVSHTPTCTKPLTTLTDMSTFREQPSGPKAYIALPRASSRRRKRFGSTNSASLNSLETTTLAQLKLPRSRSGSAAKPNPYSFYDTRLS